MALQVLSVSVELIQALKPVVKIIERQDKSLAWQIRRAASSISLTLGEGVESRMGNQPARFQEALGSGNEVRTALKVALAWGYVSEQQLAAARELLDRAMAMMWRLVHPKR